MLATLDCIAALGAKYEKIGDTVKICGKTGKTPEGAVLRCRESGSTLRFMIPPALTGGRVRFEGTPRLLEKEESEYTSSFSAARASKLKRQRWDRIFRRAHGR